METQEKYYTPTIEEFYIGQEIELHNVDNYKADYSKNENFPIKAIVTQLTNYPTVWVKSLKTENTYEVYPFMIEFKHLDREDIESLGWEWGDARPQNCFRYKGEPINKMREQLYLVFLYQNVCIYEEKNVFFNGKLKNKSELKRLMGQLGIL